MTSYESQLDIIGCPVSHEPLQPLDRRRLKSLNRHINDGQVQYVDHTTVEDRAREALITRDGKVVYLVADGIDRKSTRLNSSHVAISYAVFCLKKKTQA